MMLEMMSMIKFINLDQKTITLTKQLIQFIILV